MKKVFIAAILIFLLAQCGSDHTNPPPPIDNIVRNPYIVAHPPSQFTDNTPFDPARDLLGWLIYAMPIDNVSDSQAWFYDNNMVAYVLASDNNYSRFEFNLNLLRPHLKPGEYLIGLKIESQSHLFSEFADNVVMWELK